MTRFLSDRAFLSGRAATDTHLTPRARPFSGNAALTPGASALDDEGQRYFSDGAEWRADLPAGSEVIIPSWASVPPGWFEVPGVPGLPPGRVLIGNKYSINYALTGLLSWAIIMPGSLYTDAARTTPVTSPPSPVGGVEEVGAGGNHWTQPISADRPIWDTYTRNGETVDSLQFQAENQGITIATNGATFGSVVLFFRDGAVYLPCDFGGSDAVLSYLGDPIEEAVFFDYRLSGSELTTFVDFVRASRNRQPLDNFVAAGKTDYARLFFKMSFVTEVPTYNTSGGTIFSRTFASTGIQTLPAWDFSSAVDITRIGERNAALTNLGSPDFDEAVIAIGAFADTGVSGFDIDLPKAEDISNLLLRCLNLTTVEAFNADNAQKISRICEGCPLLTSFGIPLSNPGQPSITFPSLQGAWNGDPNNIENTGAETAFLECGMLTDLPPGMFDTATCTNYYRFATGAALSQDSVDNVLVSVAQSLTNDPSLTDGYLSLDGGTNAAPSATGQAAADQLRNAGWTVDLNGY